MWCAVASLWCADAGRSGDVIIPLRDRNEEWTEYCDGRMDEECADYSYFCQVLRSAPEIKHIKLSLIHI